MKQLLSLLLAVMVMAPGGAFGLGLGNLERQSQINEPLRATIEIIGAQADELTALAVGLADADRFKRAGLERPEVLSQLRFEVVQNELGSDYIKITSERPIREPFLNFLIEVNWPKGRLFREYTVLLDSPLYEPGVKQRRLAGPAQTTPAETATGVGGIARETRHAPDAYGPTVRGDTLWEIAAQRRPARSISVEQMMLALWRANSKAFFVQNINALKRGVVLHIPAAAEASSLSKADALAQVQQHRALWDEYRQGLASATGKRPIGTGTSRGAAPAEEQPIIAGQPSEQLKLLSAADGEVQGKGQAAGARGKEIDTLSHQLAVVNEELESKRQEIANLTANLAEDEGLIKDLKRQVEIKDAELAALQAKLVAQEPKAQTAETLPSPVTPPGSAGEPAPQPEQPVAALKSPTVPPPAVAEVPSAAPPTMETAPVEPSSTEPLPAEKIADASTGMVPPTPETGEQPQPGVPSVEGVQGGATPPSEKPQEAAEEVIETPPSQKSIFDSIPGGMITLISAAVVLLLAAIAVLRGKPQETVATPEGEGFPFSLDDLEGPVETEPPVAGRTAVDLGITQVVRAPTETQFEAEEPPFVAPERREEDLLAEMNVHLAYNRFDQAEELVKRAMESDPDEPKHILRLLEVYYAAGNKKAYEDCAKALFVAVGGMGPLWDSAVAMWREMSPQRALFDEEGEPRPENEDLSSAEFIDISEADEPAGLTGEARSIDPTKPEANIGPFDFSISEPAKEARSSDFVAAQEVGIEFDLPDMTFEPMRVEEPKGQEGNTLLSDLSWLKEGNTPYVDASNSPEEPSFTTGRGKAESDDLELAFKFFSDPGDLAVTSKQSHEEGAESLADTSDRGAEVSLFHAVEDDTESDEIDTKLNLAITYIELGETEGARPILNEIALVGNEEQQREAKELLRQLG